GAILPPVAIPEGTLGHDRGADSGAGSGAAAAAVGLRRGVRRAAGGYRPGAGPAGAEAGWGLARAAAEGVVVVGDGRRAGGGAGAGLDRRHRAVRGHRLRRPEGVPVAGP